MKRSPCLASVEEVQGPAVNFHLRRAGGSLQPAACKQPNPANKPWDLKAYHPAPYAEVHVGVQLGLDTAVGSLEILCRGTLPVLPKRCDPQKLRNGCPLLYLTAGSVLLLLGNHRKAGRATGGFPDDRSLEAMTPPPSKLPGGSTS